MEHEGSMYRAGVAYSYYAKEGETRKDQSIDITMCLSMDEVAQVVVPKFKFLKRKFGELEREFIIELGPNGERKVIGIRYFPQRTPPGWRAIIIAVDHEKKSHILHTLFQ